MVTELLTGIVAGAGAGCIHLRILATTDLHACLLPHDYFTDAATPHLGLARTAQLIAEARADAPNCLLLDNGDFLQGTPMGDYLAQATRRRGPHPMIAAFNALGYDAGTLGNHEFNFGLPYLARTLAQARHPVVSANMARALGADPTGDTTLVPPFVLLERTFRDGAGQSHALRIGIIGFTPPQTLIWDRQHLDGQLYARDIVAAARAWVPVMRARGADLVIALSHSGIGALTATPGMENATTALAAVPGIDALVAGHSHLVFPSAQHPAGPGIDPLLGCLAGKPAVMPGHSGSHLGIIDLGLRKTASGWTVASHGAVALAVAETRQHAAPLAARMAAPVRLAAASAHRATLAWTRRRIGQTAQPLSTYFALVSHGAAARLIAQAMRGHVSRALEGTAWQDLPVLAAVSPFKTGGRGGPANFSHIPAGDLRLRNAVDLYSFPNAISALCVSGADLALWLERSAGQFCQISGDTPDAPLIDTEFPSFNFDHLDGLSYRIDLSAPSRFSPAGDRVSDGRRIVGPTFGGAPLDPAARFIVATNSYRANGSGRFAGADPDSLVMSHTKLVRDVLRDHIAAQGMINHGPGGDGWAFAAQPGATVVFDSHPDAGAHLGLVPNLDLTPLGLTDAGFLRLRLAL